MAVDLAHYLLLSAVLFGIGVMGVLTRKNLIIILMCVELMLNAVNLSFIALARHAADQEAQVVVFFVLCVAAAEVAVGLAILISVWRKRGTMNIDALSALRG
ncbi:MAG: NADH-quinone oxidoreductase subunit NuoK [Calditrichaeota bacterium]|nr:NADH-quinone oxidoreductase subunit NuoK [Calditrichota bacterium]MCB9391142.1 NADH-quinone oxidoreductase subunit NuoK [Calditrichota bacterium]